MLQVCFTTVSVHVLEGSLAVTQAQGLLDERVAGLSKDRGWTPLVRKEPHKNRIEEIMKNLQQIYNRSASVNMYQFVTGRCHYQQPDSRATENMPNVEYNLN